MERQKGGWKNIPNEGGGVRAVAAKALEPTQDEQKGHYNGPMPERAEAETRTATTRAAGATSEIAQPIHPSSSRADPSGADRRAFQSGGTQPLILLSLYQFVSYDTNKCRNLVGAIQT